MNSKGFSIIEVLVVLVAITTIAVGGYLIIAQPNQNSTSLTATPSVVPTSIPTATISSAPTSISITPQPTVSPTPIDLTGYSFYQFTGEGEINPKYSTDYYEFTYSYPIYSTTKRSYVKKSSVADNPTFSQLKEGFYVLIKPEQEELTGAAAGTSFAELHGDIDIIIEAQGLAKYTATYGPTNIILHYPASWTQVPQDDLAFEGDYGHIKVYLIKSQKDLESVVQTIATQSPGQYPLEGRLIAMASSVDGEPMGAHGILLTPDDSSTSDGIVVEKLDRDITINGESYNYLVMKADLLHIEYLASLLEVNY